METPEKSEELKNSTNDLALNQSEKSTNSVETSSETAEEKAAQAAQVAVEAAQAAEVAAEKVAETAAELQAQPAAKVDAERAVDVIAQVAADDEANPAGEVLYAAAVANGDAADPAGQFPANAVMASEDGSCEEVKPERVPLLTVDDAIVRLEQLSQLPADEISRDEISRVKQHFYTFRKAEQQAALDEFVAAGNDGAAFAAEENSDDIKFKELLNIIKEKKAARAAEIEAEQTANFNAKEALIAELEKMSADTDNINRLFPRFREIQTEFKAIGEVSPQASSDQWKHYQEAIEHFYDQLKINKDLRDYDFKKNLAAKQQLIDDAEKLAAEEDTLTAFRKLQDLHGQWREIGPVAKEIREEIWTRFKDASAEINKRYQAYFEQRKAAELQNEEAKTAICERLEAMDLTTANSFNAWNDLTKQVIAAQEDWKKLGFASKKVNNALFTRFRAACDNFFALKSEYYKSVKEDLAANLEKKIALCEQAEALKDSTQWKATAEKLVELQKEWKTIGTVPKKQSDAVWNRFQAACDHFFEQKKKDLNDTRREEQANLKAKRALTASLLEIAPETPAEQVLTAIKDAQAQWGVIGHVPFREKDKIYEEFRAAINELYKRHNLREQKSNARFEESIAEITDPGKLSRERERLARVLEQKRADLATYNNNLGFLNVKSASGSSMLRDIERRSQRIKDDIADLERKIALIDEKL